MNNEMILRKKLSGKDNLNRLTGLFPGSDNRLARALSGWLGEKNIWQKEHGASKEKGPSTHEPALSGQPPVWILYGTHTGNSQQLSEETGEKLKALGLEVKVCDMESFRYNDLADVRRLLIIVSTDGDGEPPLMAEEFLEYLGSDQAPRLRHLKYSVLALGDTCYYHFCQAGKDFDLLLEKLGATRISTRVDCDVDFEEDYARWIDAVITGLSEHERH